MTLEHRTFYQDWRRRLLSIALLLVMGLGLYSGVVQQQLFNPALAPLDQRAEQALKRSLVLAGSSFATARLIDRGVAFMSEAEVGVGVASVKPGQLLKPLQDMAVRYADLMVLAMTSVGIQLILLEFGKILALQIFGFASIAAGLCWLLGPQHWRNTALLICRNSLWILLLVRLGIPLMAYSTDLLSQQLLTPQRVAAQTELNLITAQLANVEQQTDTDSSGLLNWVRQTSSKTSDIISAVKLFSDSMVERFIQLIVVYTLQTLLFPLLSLYLLWQFGRYLWRRPLHFSAIQPTPYL